MTEKINLDTVWSGIIEQSGASKENIEQAHNQIFSQLEKDRDMFAFDQTKAVVSAGGLASVIEWIDATDMIAEEKLQRAKYFVDQVRIAESREAAQSTDPSRVLARITEALSKLSQERNQ
jgi:hypothetical protein